MADYYDKYRPSYPTEIIDTIINCTNIKLIEKMIENVQFHIVNSIILVCKNYYENSSK